MRERDHNASPARPDALIKLPARISLHPRPHPFSVPGSFDQSRVRHEGGPFQSVDSPTRRLPRQYGVSYARNSSTECARLYMVPYGIRTSAHSVPVPSDRTNRGTTPNGLLSGSSLARRRGRRGSSSKTLQRPGRMSFFFQSKASSTKAPSHTTKY